MAAETNKICKPNAFVVKSRGTNVRNGVWLIGCKPRPTMNFQPQVCSENVSPNETQNWVCESAWVGTKHHTEHHTKQVTKKKWISHVAALKLLNQNNRERIFLSVFSVRLGIRDFVLFFPEFVWFGFVSRRRRKRNLV